MPKTSRRRWSGTARPAPRRSYTRDSKLGQERLGDCQVFPIPFPEGDPKSAPAPSPPCELGPFCEPAEVEELPLKRIASGDVDDGMLEPPKKL